MREYFHANGQLFSHTDLVTRPVSKTHTSWCHQDMRGSTMMLSSSHGQAVASYSYDAFGTLFGDHPRAGRPQPTVPEVARPAVERGTEYLYTGKRLDPETGVYDYGFRDYASRLARFTTVDPIKDGNNWYAYVGNDPVNRIDPLGLDGTTPWYVEEALRRKNEAVRASEDTRRANDRTNRISNPRFQGVLQMGAGALIGGATAYAVYQTGGTAAAVAHRATGSAVVLAGGLFASGLSAVVTGDPPPLSWKDAFTPPAASMANTWQDENTTPTNHMPTMHRQKQY